MGIDGLNKWLRDKHNNVFTELHISKFAFKKVCFDISSYIYKFISIYGKDDNKWLNAFITLILLWRQYAVNFIPVFDGKSPIEKDEEKVDRGEQREKGDVKCFQLKLDLSRFKDTKEKSIELVKLMKKLSIKKYNDDEKNKMKRLLHPINEDKKEVVFTDDIDIDIDIIQNYLDNRERNIFSILPEDLNLLKTLFDKFKIPYFQAPDEAEALCCYLVKAKLADATFSLDSDCIAYQVPVIINDLDVKTGICRVIYFDKLCEELELDSDEITTMLILCRCDYNRWTSAIKGIGPVSAHKIVKKWHTYDEIKKNDKRFQIEDDGYRYNRCVELFNLQYPDIKQVPSWDLRINIDNITDWLTSNNFYCDKAKIKTFWNPPKIIFDDDNKDSKKDDNKDSKNSDD